MPGIEGPMNLVKLTKVGYADVTGLETVAPTTLAELTAGEIQQGKFNWDNPAASVTQEYAADGTTYRSRKGSRTTSATLSLHSVLLSTAKNFIPGTYTQGVADSTPSKFVSIGNEIVSNKYIEVEGLNNVNQTVKYILYNAHVIDSQSGNIDEAQETVPLTIKFDALYHKGLNGTYEQDVSF